MGGALLGLLSSCASDPPESLRLARADGTTLRVFDDVSHARESDTRARGLSGAPALADDQAMVLDFPVVDEACITNRDVAFGIVAIYAGPAGEVLAVESFSAHDARIVCHDGVLTVVELGGGAASAASAAARVVLD